MNMKRKAVPATSHGDPKDCQMSRLPHYLDNQITDGSELISLMNRPLSIAKMTGTHFCSKLNRHHGHSAAEGIGSTEHSNHFVVNRTRGLPTCGIVPQPTTVPFSTASRIP